MLQTGKSSSLLASVGGTMETSLKDRDKVGVQDTVLLENYTDENVFVDNLRKRFKEDLIYVRIREDAAIFTNCMTDLH
ncbi:myosin [Holotrichia oblita]|uniref:Myosin n=1 Tax=Holotrichia oblita TaxID=644536 RepID=A0ACB9TWJ7_HOLOL|nr:myosin [Holotrichia oblita]